MHRCIEGGEAYAAVAALSLRVLSAFFVARIAITAVAVMLKNVGMEKIVKDLIVFLTFSFSFPPSVFLSLLSVPPVPFSVLFSHFLLFHLIPTFFLPFLCRQVPVRHKTFPRY